MRRFFITGIVAGLLVTGCIERSPDWAQCVDIEMARCDLRAVCKPSGDLGNDRDLMKYLGSFSLHDCEEYATEHCRTREIVGNNVEKVHIDECVAAIALVPCVDIDPGANETASLSECAFIKPDDPDDWEEVVNPL